MEWMRLPPGLAAAKSRIPRRMRPAPQTGRLGQSPQPTAHGVCVPDSLSSSTLADHAGAGVIGYIVAECMNHLRKGS